MSLETNFYLLIRGKWLPLPDVDPDISKKIDRGRSSWTSMGGVRREQFVRKSNATWGIAHTNRSADAWRLLTYVASGNAGEVWLYDVQAAQANLLDENSTQGSSATPIVVDGIPMPAFTAGETVTRKIRNGVAYHLAFTTSHTAGATVGTYKIGAAAAVNIVAPTSTGPRRGSVSFIPTSDADLVITWTVAGKTSGAVLSESSVSASGFLPGENTPCRVAISDRSQKLDEAYSDQLSNGSVSFEIREIG